MSRATRVGGLTLGCLLGALLIGPPSSFAQVFLASNPEPMGDGAPFVTFVRRTNSGGLSNPGTVIRIPWHEWLGDPTRMATLQLISSRVIRDKPQTWLDELFWGKRHIASLTFGDVRFSSLYGLYFEWRDRLVPMAGDLSQLTLRFGDANHLRLDEINPPGASSQRSQTRKDTETVTLVLDTSDGLKPQLLRASFAYFDGLHAILPIVLTVAVFSLGHLGGPLVGALFRRGAAAMARRVHIASRRGTSDHTSGVVLSKDTLGRIMPGETTYEQVLALCGPHGEEHEQLKTPGRRSLIYRGRRTVPHQRRTFGRLATVSHWDIEHHEVTIDFEGDLVTDLQAHVRRSRSPGAVA